MEKLTVEKYLEPKIKAKPGLKIPLDSAYISMILQEYADFQTQSLQTQLEEKDMDIARYIEHLTNVETENKELRELRDQSLITLNHAKIFIQSREKMHPTGRELYNELIQKLTDSKNT